MHTQVYSWSLCALSFTLRLEDFLHLLALPLCPPVGAQLRGRQNSKLLVNQLSLTWEISRWIKVSVFHELVYIHKNKSRELWFESEARYVFLEPVFSTISRNKIHTRISVYTVSLTCSPQVSEVEHRHTPTT